MAHDHLAGREAPECREEEPMGDIDPNMGRAFAQGKSQANRPLDLDRKQEVFNVAKSIAAIINLQVTRRERCLLHGMVEMLLDA